MLLSGEGGEQKRNEQSLLSLAITCLSPASGSAKGWVPRVNADYRAQELLEERRAGNRQAASDSETKENPAQGAHFKIKITTRGAPESALALCVSACVRAHRLLGGRLFPFGLPVSRRASGPPNGRGRRKMAAAANSGSSLPLFDCPTW